MRPPHHILDRKKAHRLAVEHLQAHLKFQDYKRKTSAPVLWSLLLAAAARITSLSDTCQRLRDAPSDATAYVVRKGQRYTVALTGVQKGEALKDVVQRLLRQAAHVGIRTRLLLL